MFRKSWLLGLTITILAATAGAGTFGTVVAIGGEASDIALDESRGVLYIANLTANRIDVMTLANKRVQTSINVAPNPAQIALSPDGHWLVVLHFGNNTAPATPNNALTLIDLTANNSRQTFALADPPVGVAFGIDNQALVVTTTSYILFDPTVGTTRVLDTISNVLAQTLPVPPATFPGNITNSSVIASADGLHVYGMGNSTGTFTFKYDVATHTVLPGGVVLSSGTLGPRVVSMNGDGSKVMVGWLMVDNKTGVFLNDIPNRSNDFSIGTTTFDNQRGLVYAHIPAVKGESPTLQIMSGDNLQVLDRLQLPENTTGKSVMTSDSATMYSVSDSGVLVLPVGNLGNSPRVTASAQDMVFRGNFCDRSVATQTLTITDPGGGATPFKITPNQAGIIVSPASGITPAVVQVRVDPNVFAPQKGTVTAALTIASGAAVNIPSPVRLLINSQDPAQRGNFINVPGKLVDVVADAARNRYYILRQSHNDVLVFNAANHTQVTSLRTYNVPTSLALTSDNQYLLVGHQNSQTVAVFDLDTFQAQPYISTEAGAGNTVRSIAVTNKGIFATSVDFTGVGHVLKLDLPTHSATQLPTLGLYQNKIDKDSVITTSANASKALVASVDGTVLLYDSNADSFVASRKDFTSLLGPYAASAFDQYVVGSNVLDASLTPVAKLQTSNGSPSGFAFVNSTGYFTSSSSTSSPGVIAQVDARSGTAIQPTFMVEAPILGLAAGALPPGTVSCQDSITTSAGTTTTTTTCTQGSAITTTVQTCTSSTSGTTTTSTCSTATSSGQTNASNAWTRTLAPLPNQTAMINLTTSGFTVLPWSYAASVAPPQVTKIVSAADGVSAVAPGGLISILGNQLSAINLATSEIPLATALANSCLTVNGQPTPLVFVSPNQINAQMPAQAVGNVTVNVHTPGGTSDNFNLTVQPTAPAVFMSGVAGPQTNLPVVVRADNNLLVTDSNPIHRNDLLTIYLTGCGQTTPGVGDGLPAPSDPLATTLITPVVALGGTQLPVSYAGLAPGQVGVCQINASVPRSAPTGLNMPLVINQGGSQQTLSLRVVN
jgi:uncharacterized protein (TIGR03437 family)